MKKRPRPRAEKTQSPADAAKLDVRTIAGYTAIRLPPAPKQRLQDTRWVYLRPHSDGVLFIANLSALTTVSDLRSFLPSASADDANVEVHIMPGSINKFGRIRVDGGAETVTAILSSPLDWIEPQALTKLEALPKKCPVEKWFSEYYAARDSTEVTKWSEATMATFEHREKIRLQEEEEALRKAAEPDDDGFVVVKRSTGAATAAARALRGPTATPPLKTTLQKKSQPSTTSGPKPGIAPEGFYRWQRADSRKKELRELRKQFEEDKKRVAALQHLASE